MLHNFIEDVKPDFVIHAAIKGGTAVDKDGIQELADNVKMFDNLMACLSTDATVFVIGSGAEFDKSSDIDCACEIDLDNSYPTDPYGMAKNIISRKALHDYENTYVVRLFGCFSEDEEPYRFIKSCILSIKNNTPIIIHQDRQMDFFYMDDVCQDIHSLMIYGGVRHINLVYTEKYSLLNIAQMVIRAAGLKTYQIVIEKEGMGTSYTGDSLKLDSMGLKLVGLEEGIVRTVKALL
jgi:nucleoside-diphosphate-sugar epimerase